MTVPLTPKTHRKLAASWLCRALLVVSAALAVGAPALEARADDTRKEAAKSMFKVAVEAFQQGRYREALQKLDEVYRLDPDPVILYNMGRSHEELGELAEAAEYFQRAVADQRLPKDLQAEVGIRLPKVLPALRLRQALMLTAQAVDLGIRRSLERSSDAVRPEEEPPPVAPAPFSPGPMFWAGGGVSLAGVVALVGGAVVDLGLSSKIDELEKESTRRDRDRTLALHQEIEDGQTLAAVLYGVGGLALVSGGVLVFLSLPDSAEDSASAATSWQIGPMLGSQAGLSLTGSF